jgi:hypothetical protein
LTIDPAIREERTDAEEDRDGLFRTARGNLWLNVTVLSRKKDSESIRQTLQALREAEQTRG